MTFTEHKFIQKLTSDRLFYHRNKISSKESSFCINVFVAASKIEKVLKDLMLIRRLIAEIHPESDVKSNSLIDPEQLLKYHIENYFLRITTYKDLLMKLINIIYDWGIKDGNGYEMRLVKKAERENVFSVLKIIEDVNIMLSSVKEIRNRLAHEGELDNVDVSLLNIQKGIENFIDNLPNLNCKKEDFFDPDLTSKYLSITILQNIVEMMNIEKDLATNLFKNLDFLYVKYTQVIPEERPIK